MSKKDIRPQDITPSLVKRFREKVSEPDNRGCTNWTGHISASGYGQFWINNDVRSFGPHRLALILAVGFPVGKQLALHSCDNPICVNPAHLRWGSYADNASDRESRKRGADRRGANHPMSRLSWNDVEEIRSSPMTASEIAEQFGVTRDHIYQIRNGKRWKNVQTLRREAEAA